SRGCSARGETSVDVTRRNPALSSPRLRVSLNETSLRAIVGAEGRDVLLRVGQLPPPDAAIRPYSAAATTWSATERRSACIRLFPSVSYVRLVSSTTQVPSSGSIQMEVPV